jgi:tRNA-splicing ligase RtcB
MPIITGDDLLDAGWTSGPDIGKALEAAAEYEARGITDRKYLLKLIKKQIPVSQPKPGPRDEPAPFSEAIEATCPEDEKNIGAVRRQMRDLLCTPVIERGAVMPDACPAGAERATIPVGGAIAVKNAIIPSAHSADICCSMYATFFHCDGGITEMLDALMASTRFGYGGRKDDDLVHHPVLDEDVWDNPFLTGLKNHALIHMADQGDGNHFAYIGEVEINAAQLDTFDKNGQSEIAAAIRAASGENRPFKSYALVTHHGSRGLGAHLYKRGQKAAEKHTNKVARNIPKSAMWIDYDTEVGAAYWDALQYIGRWTKANHQSIHARFLEKAAATPVCEFGNEHNFVWKRGDTFLHGKGATPAWKGDDGHPLIGLIPLNMAKPILITLGRDNEQYLSFCPHGAGRNISRTATIRPYKNKDGELDEKLVAQKVAEQTTGLDIRWYYGKPDLSESPLGYKSAEQVKAQIAQFGLADVVAEITPLGCIMAGDTGTPPWMRRKDILSPKQIRQIEHRADRRKLRQEIDQDFSEE